MGFSQEFQRISRAEADSAAARFIYNEVRDWRGSEKKPIAVKRWLWELLQNARDCASGQPFSFNVSWKPAELIVRHNAGPFKLREIVALVEGDSSKQRRSVQTTGKFGKGFLVTHVISTEVRVRGVLADADRGRFGFTFQLSRGGSEGEIIQNIRKCAQALDDVHPVHDDSCETRFTYYLSPNDQSRFYIEEALRGLRNHAPYLFAFIPELKDLTCVVDGEPEAVFTSLPRKKIDVSPVLAMAELVPVKTPTLQRNVLTVLKNRTRAQEPKPAMIAFELLNWPEKPEINTAVTYPIAKIFQDLPLHGTEDLGLPVVINLPRTSEVDSDRAGPDLNDNDTLQVIGQALSLVPFVIDWAKREKMAGLYRLTEFGISEDDRDEPEKAQAWVHVIQPVLEAILSRTVVETSRGTFARIEEAVFPKSTWLELEKPDMELLRGTRELLELRGDSVPTAETLEDWESIILKWKAFPSVPRPRLIGLKELFAGIENTKKLSALQKAHSTLALEGAALGYVCEVFGVASQYCRRHNIIAPRDLAKAPIILNQCGVFLSPEILKLDREVDDLLKDISTDLGIPFRERLVHRTLADSEGGRLVMEVCGNRTMETATAVAELMSAIERQAAGMDRSSSVENTKNAAVKLLVWLAAHEPHAAPHDLKPFPLLCEDRRLRSYAELHEVFLLPMEFLVEGERDWASLLPDYVRLSDEYVKCCELLGVDANRFEKLLQGHGLASASLVFDREVDFDSELVAALQSSLTTSSGHRIERLRAKDVAGFTRLLSDSAGISASGTWSQAETVMRFVLSWLVSQDSSWKTSISLPCAARQKHDCPRTLTVFPCQWLGKLKTMAWIPSGDSGGSCEPLNSRTVKVLLDKLPPDIVVPAEVRKFLSLHCSIDELELAIRAAAKGDRDRESELRNQWAQVVDTAQPSEVLEFVNRRRTASEINTRNNLLGRIVERLVKSAFANEGFDTEKTGVGSDFRATMSRGADPEWEKQDVGRLTFKPSYQGESVTFLVEVKATREDSVRMSWIQADTAAKNSANYVLCVVDFAGNENLFDQVLAADDPRCDIIAGSIRVVPTIGENLATAVQNLSSAAVSQNPGIEVERADEIRFRVLNEVWTKAQELYAWARFVKETLTGNP